MELISSGLSVKSFNAATASVGNGTTFALPARAALVTWQFYFTGNPASLTMLIQTSIDNVIWNTADSDTTITGALKTFETAARFIRARLNAVSGSPTGMTVDISAKAIE